MLCARCARQSTPRWAGAEVMIDEVSTASGGDRVVDGVSVSLYPNAQINCNASRRSRRADIEVSVAKRLVRQSIEGDRLVGLGDAEGVYTRS